MKSAESQQVNQWRQSCAPAEVDESEKTRARWQQRSPLAIIFSTCPSIPPVGWHRLHWLPEETPNSDHSWFPVPRVAS